MFAQHDDLVRGFARVASCCSSLGIAALLSVAASAAQEPVVSFAETTEVRVVHLDVLVLDARGESVDDLRREDFLVREDGAIVELDFFERPPRRPGGDAPLASVQGPAATTASAAAAARRGGPLEWVVFVDDLRLDGAARKRALRDLEKLFAEWEEGSLLRLLIQRDDELIARGPFDDPREMSAALADRPKGLVRGVLSKIARRRTMEQLAGVREACALSGRDLCTDCWGEQLAVATRHAVDEVERVEVTALHLRNLLTRLDASEGRRSLLYVGDGLPLLAGAAVFWSLGEQCSERRSEIEGEVAQYRLERVFQEVGALANAQRVAFHLLDAGGLRSGAFGPTSSNDAEHFRNLQAGLQTLAEQTGGSAILNANRAIDPVRRSVREEVARYELGYTLSRPATGRVHRVEIDLVGAAREGRKLRYRKSYWDRTPQMRLVQAMVAAASGGLQADATGSEGGPARLVLRLADPTSSVPQAAPRLEQGSGGVPSTSQRRVLLQIALSEELAVAVPVEDGQRRGAVTLAVLLRDERGRDSEPRVRRLELGGSGLQPQQGWYFVDLALHAARGERVFVVGVRDEVSGQVETARLAAEIP